MADRSDPWSRALGTERCDRAFRTRDLLDSGAVVALGSDWPVARFDPRRGWPGPGCAARPVSATRSLPTADQVLTALEALEGYTTGAAFAVGEEGEAGRIAVGFRADLTAVAADPVETDADELVGIPVTLTVVDGEIVHRSE